MEGFRRTAISIIALCGTLAAACATPPPPAETRSESSFLKVEYAGRKGSGDTKIEGLSEASRLRFSLDGTMVIEHAVSDRSTTVLPLAAGPHRLTFQGISAGEGGFSDTFDIAVTPGATATLTVLCDAYFTGKKKKNLLMNRWEKELALECEMLSSDGFATLQQLEGKEERNILDTQWVEQ